MVWRWDCITQLTQIAHGNGRGQSSHGRGQSSHGNILHKIMTKWSGSVLAW